MPSVKKPQNAGLAVKDLADAVKGGPGDGAGAGRHQRKIYAENIEPNLKKGVTLAFAHGFNIHYNQIVPRADLDVSMNTAPHRIAGPHSPIQAAS